MNGAALTEGASGAILQPRTNRVQCPFDPSLCRDFQLTFGFHIRRCEARNG